MTDTPMPLTVPLSQEDLAAGFTGAAVYANRIFVSTVGAGLRLAFLEQQAPEADPIFRTAVVLAYADAISLRNLLNQQLEPLEKALAAGVVQAVDVKTSNG